MKPTPMINETLAQQVIAELPRVSVVIPVKNDAQRLELCLASLGKQDYPSEQFEVVVIDNGSTDNSGEVARQQGARLLSFPGLRVGALRNRGVEIATGELIAFVDSDHEVPPQWLSSAVEQLEHDKLIRMLGSPCLAPLNGSWVQKGWEKHRLRDRRRREVDWLGAGNMFLWRSDFLACQGFREDLVASEDVDLCYRVAKLGKIVSDMCVANVHYGEPDTLSQFFWKEYWRGSSGVRAFISQGFPLRDLPSLVWPAYHLILFLAALIALIGLAWWSATWLCLAIGLWIMPSLLLAGKTSVTLREGSALPSLWVLYFVFGLSRALALFKR